ncbi:MAG: nitrite/sulfite reductase [Eubacteriales bacterium]|nr:nitrite/sulfite reductase [Eubacteriales bacterium]
MTNDLFTEYFPDLTQFREKTLRFHRGELSVAEYKLFSGGFGSYAQRGGQTHMLRLRMAGGRLTKERLKFIVDTCEKYCVGRIKLTSCQSVQLHDLKADELCNIMEAAWRAGMISRGGGGDFPRNVMASPLSGVSLSENFDVMPYAEAAGEYLMGFIKAVRFPRKLKVCFSSSPANEPHATFRDLGFAANPDHTFDVYAAGGLGVKPRLGVRMAQGVSPADVLYHIKAMVDTFTAYGDYENRAKSRSRFLQDTLGQEGLIQAYQEKLSEALSVERLTLSIPQHSVTKKGNGRTTSHKRILPQKQPGLYAVSYQPIGGFLSPIKAAQLCRAIAPMEEVEIRLTPEGGLYLINCDAAEADLLLKITDDGAQTRFETSTACVGADTCQVGIGHSQALLSDCIAAVRRENFADGVLPRIHISGCPSSCAAHQTAAIGFRGGMKQTPAGPKPAFAVFTGGSSLQGQETIAETGRLIAAADIPRFLTDLGRMIAAQNTTYEKWLPQHKDALQDLINKYA